MPIPAGIAHLVTARRTPFGAVHGLLSGWHPVDLLAHTMRVTLDDAGVSAEDVSTVLVGCAHPVGAQSFNIGRAAVLTAGWPDRIPATTVERGSGSSQRALHFAAHAIRAGALDLAVVAGVEVMSLVPAGAPALNRQYGPIWGQGPADRYANAGGLIPAGVAGDRLASRNGIDRAMQDDEAARSRDRASSTEHPPWLVVTPTRLNDRDQPRAALTVMLDDEAPGAEPAADCAPLHDDGGTVAATNIAPPADGASVAVLASTRWVTEQRRSAPMVIVGCAEGAVDPVTMFGAGPAAARGALDQAGLVVTDLVAVELDAPHAAAALQLRTDLGVDPAIVNRTGGGLGRGRPLGAVGVGMMAEVVGLMTHRHEETGPVLMVDENDDGTATATVLAPDDSPTPTTSLTS